MLLRSLLFRSEAVLSRRYLSGRPGPSTSRPGNSTRREGQIKPNKSHVRAKLGHFIETGQVLRKSPSQYESKNRFQKNPFDINYTNQKALLVIQANFEGKLEDSQGKMINTRYLKVADINPSSPKSKEIFQALLKVGKTTKKPISKRLMMSLIGVPMNSLEDSFVVTKEVLKRLEQDNDTTRALWLAKAAKGETAAVAMNAIMQFLLEKGDIQAGIRNFNDRKKWRIPLNNQTYVILFNGIAKASSWGGVSNTLAQQASDIFQKFMKSSLEVKPKDENDIDTRDVLKCSIEHFNACLDLLSRNFEDEQAHMWAFFDLLIPVKPEAGAPKYEYLFANIQTYTILLSGIKKYCNSKANAVITDRNMKKEEKLVRLLDIDAKLVSSAEMILGKVIKDATPPKPPTKEQVDENPELLVRYKREIKKPLLDIDTTFVVRFVSCFINSASGTGVNTSSGSHYRYVEQGMNYLSVWCPDVEPLLKYVLDGKHYSEDAGYTKIRPNRLLVRLTDERVKMAEEYEQNKPIKKSTLLTEAPNFKELLPSTVLPDPVDINKVNPKVVFPPPLSSKNKTRALYSNKEKNLVDLTRYSSAALRAVIEDKKYQKSRGKYGKKLSKSMQSNMKGGEPINRFVIGLVIEGLLSLGLFEEFYLAMWYCLCKWGGIKVDLNKIKEQRIKNGGLQNGLLSQDDFCKILDENDSKQRYHAPHNDAVIDTLMIENFLYKISEEAKKTSPSVLSVELLTALISPKLNVEKTLQPRDKSIGYLFSILTNELYHYKDSNFNASRKATSSGATPRRALTEEQLETLTTTIIKLMDTLAVQNKLQNRGHPEIIVNEIHIDSYVRFVEKVQEFVWPQDVSFKLKTHLRIFRSGVLMYMPPHMIDKRKIGLVHTNRVIRPSMEFLIETMSKRDDLTPMEAKLFKWTKVLSKYQGDSHEKLKGIIQKVIKLSEDVLDGKEVDEKVDEKVGENKSEEEKLVKEPEVKSPQLHVEKSSNESGSEIGKETIAPEASRA
ncbi:hypothetical protein CAAN4_B10748 [[Candida] anglica]|uniref:Mitochondrial group I intron splicing factor CCM1 n=1 Tax=[Candida] anglica TaxID=148631 RepID=A0ABP0E825_9ASCO